jgi:hypothetical protein
MLVTTVLSIGLFVLVSAVERIALPWYRTDERQQSWGEAEL